MSLLVVVAHYDDETIGASHQLMLDRRAGQILHVTDSAPLDLRYAQRAGFKTRNAYATARRKEMLQAVKLIGIHPAQCHALDIPDQEAPRRVGEIASAVENIVRQGGITRVFTHAYEGGHPDHDACALAVHIALRVRRGVRLYEMPFYHAAHGTLQASQFLPHPGAGNPIDRRFVPLRRMAMFRRFATQAHVFSRFPVDREPYRLAPRYDFRQPPHPGPLYYETRPLNWTWPQWQAAVQQQIERLSP